MANEAAITVAVEQRLREHFEVAPQRASISFVGVPQIEVLRYAAESETHFVTLGMSVFPLVEASESAIDTATAPRAELMLTTRDAPETIWKNLAVLAAAPAVEGAVYRVGGRIDLTQPLVAGSLCTGGVLAESALEPVPVDGFADIEILSLLPATATELAWARVHGTDALIARWRAAGTPLTELARAAVDLS